MAQIASKAMGKATRPLSKGERTREQIIKAAITQFSRKGYENVSLNAIADACGIAATTPLHHFESKSGLFSEIVAYVQKKKLEILLSTENYNKDDNAFQRILMFTKLYLSYYLVYSSEAEIFLQLQYFAAHDAQYAALYKIIVDQEKSILEDYLHSGLREGLFNFKESPSQMALTVYSQVIGLSIQILAGRFLPIDRSDFDKKFAASLARLIDYKPKTSDR